MNLSGVRITGTGSCLPERVVTNDELSQDLDTSDEWIRTRTGIRERRFASEDEATSDFAIPAAKALIFFLSAASFDFLATASASFRCWPTAALAAAMAAGVLSLDAFCRAATVLGRCVVSPSDALTAA